MWRVIGGKWYRGEERKVAGRNEVERGGMR